MAAALHVTYDATVDAAYIYLGKPGLGTHIGPTLFCERDVLMTADVNVDFDLATGRVFGIEVLRAGEGLPAEVLAEAERIDGRHIETRVAERVAWRTGWEASRHAS